MAARENGNEPNGKCGTVWVRKVDEEEVLPAILLFLFTYKSTHTFGTVCLVKRNAPRRTVRP